MSAITLDMLLDAATDALPNGSDAEIGQLVADLVVKFDAEQTPKPKAKRTPAPKRTPAKPKAATMAPNWKGIMMKADAGTATKNQRNWLVERGMSRKTVVTLSMVAASNLRAKLDGKI